MNDRQIYPSITCDATGDNPHLSIETWPSLSSSPTTPDLAFLLSVVILGGLPVLSVGYQCLPLILFTWFIIIHSSRPDIVLLPLLASGRCTNRGSSLYTQNGTLNAGLLLLYPVANSEFILYKDTVYLIFGIY